MCCFAGGQVQVSSTNIFARRVGPATQALAYGMTVGAAADVAMVLPLPVAPGAGDDAVFFLDLHEHRTMFAELDALFVSEVSRGGTMAFGLGPATLKVHQVGAFVASYVPSRADFDRLDPRFRIGDALFDAVPAYADYGFAVFQLAPGRATLHPMAFTFPTRRPDALFFPTVHVHDGRFHATADFDHSLYYQRPGGAADGDDLSRTGARCSYGGVAVADELVARRTLDRRLPNQDTWIGA